MREKRPVHPQPVDTVMRDSSRQEGDIECYDGEVVHRLCRIIGLLPVKYKNITGDLYGRVDPCCLHYCSRGHVNFGHHFSLATLGKGKYCER